MKIAVKGFVFLICLLVFNCKNESNTQGIEKEAKSETLKSLTEDEKREIVAYYLIHGKKMTEKDFYKIIFLNDFVDGVKVIYYEDSNAFFGLKFSEALDFYNANKE